MDAPKLELRKNNRQLDALKLVRAAAHSRTNQRIAMITADLELQKAKKEGVPLDAPKKESK